MAQPGKRSVRESGRVHEGGENIRVSRLRELIKNETNLILRTEMRDPRLDDVDVTMVDLTPDGSCARIWFSAPGEANVAPVLERAAGFIRTQLAEGLGLKRIPELRFRRDPATRSLRADVH